jgi:Nup85 Nucleoporin
VPLESQVQVDNFVELCFDLHLESQRAHICQEWARQLEHGNQVGLALLYFERGQSFADIERICWNYFERLLLTGNPSLTHLTLGGTDQNLDPKLVEMLQSPPQSPMSGTLIAPVALLYNFFGLKVKGNAAAAVQHLSKLFRLSSMPREYIALLMAEMLPIFDGMIPLEGD